MYTQVKKKLDVLLALQEAILDTLQLMLQHSAFEHDEWLDNSDVKRLLKISDSSLYRLRKNQHLPAKRIAGKWYYSKLAIAAIMSSETVDEP